MTIEGKPIIDLAHYDGTWGVNVTGYPEFPRPDQHAASAGTEQVDVTTHRVSLDAHASKSPRTPRRHR
jgi:hypothetical protein